MEGLLALLLCQLAGTFVVDALRLPLPGPVLGMLLMLAYLGLRRPRPDAPVLRVADGLLGIMPLLFVPAGVGVVVWLSDLRAQWLPIGVGFVLPWAAGLLTTAATAGILARRYAPRADGTDEPAGPSTPEGAS